jgi:Protein of unknown function (DUF1553)/Protein of unknown function (DUF1549)
MRFGSTALFPSIVIIPMVLGRPGAATGAELPWAFVAPQKTAISPASGPHRDWPKGELDRLTLAAMLAGGHTPAKPADRPALLRRLSLDLTGLPPSPAEQARFLANRAPNAVAAEIDRLLASPHFGEHWGRHWLDAARYADSNGYEKDMARSIWPYRDWVIDAFNRDLTLAEFATAQLAGDLVEAPTLQQTIATGFLRNAMTNEEGGVDPEESRVEAIIDRVDAVSKTFLGLTVACAQCHDHKFDPISQREYYQFFAFLNNDDEAIIEVPTAAQELLRDTIQTRVTELKREALARPGIFKAMSDWTRSVPPRAHWSPLKDPQIFGAFGQKFEKLEDESYLAKGDRNTEATYTVTGKTQHTPTTPITGIRIELLTHASLFFGGPGRDDLGRAVVTEIQVSAAPASEPTASKVIRLSKASATVESEHWKAAAVIDGDNQTGWSTGAAGIGRRNQSQHLVLVPDQPFGYPGGTILTVSIVQRMGARQTVGRFRITTTANKAIPLADPLSPQARNLLGKPASNWTPAEQTQLFEYYRIGRPEFAALTIAIDEAFSKWPTGETTMVLRERQPARATRIFTRGDFRRPGETVGPDVPRVLPSMQTLPRNRLGLAQWIASPQNPLTGRVLVNRAWQALFSQGLADTPDDFGARAAKPGNQALLDWLALEFVREGGRMKPLLRTILLSATYQQSSNATPAARQKDPDNRLLARGSRFRLDAESIRDVMLSASGLLTPTIGGPSVFPVMPAGLVELTFGGRDTWKTATGSDRYRRGMYTFWKRTLPYPSMATFDAPEARTSCVRRDRSNTPLQALTTLNDPVFMEAAQALALRVWREAKPNDSARIRHAFSLALGRTPTANETRSLEAFVAKQRRHFRGNTRDAVLVSAAALENPPSGVDLHTLAPWTMVSRVLLNLDETITRE